MNDNSYVILRRYVSQVTLLIRLAPFRRTVDYGESTLRVSVINYLMPENFLICINLHFVMWVSIRATRYLIEPCRGAVDVRRLRGY